MPDKFSLYDEVSQLKMWFHSFYALQVSTIYPLTSLFVEVILGMDWVVVGLGLGLYDSLLLVTIVKTLTWG